jgi:hypothetical protein
VTSARPLFKPSSFTAWLRRHNYDIAVRYRPVVELIRREDPDQTWRILDVGAGDVGVGAFLPGWRVVGLDRSAATTRRPPGPFVWANALSLPSANEAWDVVTCVDVLEHVAPRHRSDVIDELLRVGRRCVIIGFPCGAVAARADQAFADLLAHAGRPLPEWLIEHLRYPHPDTALIEAALRRVHPARGAQLQMFFNESLRIQRTHRFLARHSPTAYRIWSLACSLALPRLAKDVSAGIAYRCFSVIRFKSVVD